MSLIEIYEASLTGKVKVNFQYKASKICYTKGSVPKKKKTEKVWSAICKYLLGNYAQGEGEDLKVSLCNATLCVSLYKTHGI